MSFLFHVAPATASYNASLTNKAKVSFKWQQLVWFLLSLGMLLRLFHFFYNRSLWLDEIYLSTSLIKMNFEELTAPMLEYEQKAPLGFLWLVKVSVLLFGKNEMALRLVPLLGGLASLFLFLPVARYFLQPLGVVVAVGIIALAPPLVYHAVEIKQYSTEMLATIVALYLYIHYHRKQDLGSLLLWGVGGALLIWFSYSVIFILAGMAIGCGLYYLLKKDWPLLFRSLVPFTLWLISFAVYYLLFTSKSMGSDWLVDWFAHREAFMPLPPTKLSDLKWFIHTSYKLMDYPMGLLWFSPKLEINFFLRIILRMTLLPLGLFLFGLGVIFSKNKKYFLILILPLLLTLVASGFKAYPIYERLLVFLAPLLIIFMAQGCESITNFFSARSKWIYIVPVLLLAGPLVNSITQAINPDKFGKIRQFHRDSFLYINERYKPGDAVYIYWNELPAYRFYKSIYNLKYKAIEGRDVRFASKDINDYFRKLSPDFKTLENNKRIWLVYDRNLFVDIGDFSPPDWYRQAHISQPYKFLIHNKFAAMGKEIDAYKTEYIAVVLFNLNNKNYPK